MRLEKLLGVPGTTQGLLNKVHDTTIAADTAAVVITSSKTATGYHVIPVGTYLPLTYYEY